jgi:hypothetical protein
MTNSGDDGRNAPDTLIVPAILVPDGEPEPHEWLAQHPDAIRLRATVVPQQLPLAEAATPRPTRSPQADAPGSERDPRPTADEDRPEPDRSPRTGAPGSGYDDNRPMAAYLCVREALAGQGQARPTTEPAGGIAGATGAAEQAAETAQDGDLENDDPAAQDGAEPQPD